MGVPLLNINFYGHDDSASSGRESTFFSGGSRTTPFHRLASIHPPRDEISGVTCNYNAILGPGNFTDQVDQIVDAAIKKYRWISEESVVNVLITGYSAGGITAICAGRAVNRRADASLLYIGVADAAIDTTDPLQVSLGQSPSVTATYAKNYYQDLGNQGSQALLSPNLTPAEWHGAMSGFVSICLNGEGAVKKAAASTDPDDDPHEAACKIGCSRMKDDLNWCDATYGSPIYVLAPDYGTY